MTGWRWMLAVLAAGSAPAAAFAQAPPIAQAAPVPVPLATVPFELSGNRIFIAVDGPGFAGRRFLVDTGAELTHFSYELAAEAGILTGAPLAVLGLTPRSAGGVETAGVALGIGGARLRIERGAALPSASLAGPEPPFDGIIGRDLFDDHVVEIDYELRLIRLFDPTGWTRPQGAEPLALAILEGKPYAEARLHLARGAPLPALLQLDTGFGGAVAVSHDYAEAEGLLERIGPHIASAVRGIGGEAPARLGRIQGLGLGSLILPEPLVTISLEKASGARPGSAGRVGGALLRRFRISFDYSRATVYLEPNAAFARVLEVDMSGLSLVSGDGVRVARVASGSPAAEAGVKAGDRLLEVDGRPAEAAGLEAVRAAFFEPGAVRMLRLLRRGRVLTVPVRLRRRI